MAWYKEHPPETPLSPERQEKAVTLYNKYIHKVIFIIRWGRAIVLGTIVLLFLAFCVAPAMIKRGNVLEDSAPFLAAMQAGDLETALSLSQDGSPLATALVAGEFAQFATLTDIDWDNALRFGYRNGSSYAQVQGDAQGPLCEVDLYLRVTDGAPSHLSLEPQCEDDATALSVPPDRPEW